MENSVELNRVLWASRRGMLELDLVLEPFAREAYPALSPEDQRRYRDLLECEDQDLYSWFLGRVSPDSDELTRIVDAVLAFARRTD